MSSAEENPPKYEKTQSKRYIPEEPPKYSKEDKGNTFNCSECDFEKKGTYMAGKCTLCKIDLCEVHLKRAAHYGKYYRHYELNMCSACCWWEVT